MKSALSCLAETGTDFVVSSPVYVLLWALLGKRKDSSHFLASEAFQTKTASTASRATVRYRRPEMTPVGLIQ